MDFSNASLSYADLTDALYELKFPQKAINAQYEIGTVQKGAYCNPNTDNIATAIGLDRLWYKDNPGSLTQLRENFRQAGYRDAAIKVNAALRRSWLSNKSNQNIWDRIHFWFESTLFDKPSGYGVYPFRPLRWVFLGLFPISIFFYLVIMIISPEQKSFNSIIHTSVKYGIYIKKAPLGITPTEEIDELSKIFKINIDIHPLSGITRRLLRGIGYATLLSLMATFNIGFRDLNVGRWIRLVLPIKLDIQTQGFPRVIFGIHSIVSVYLIALSILTYFANPFEFGG